MTEKTRFESVVGLLETLKPLTDREPALLSLANGKFPTVMLPVAVGLKDGKVVSVDISALQNYTFYRDEKNPDRWEFRNDAPAQ